MSENQTKSNISNLQRSLTLERFFPLVFLSFLVIFIILSVVTYKHINRYKNNVESVNRTYQILNKNQRVGNYLRKIQLNCQNYLISDDSTYLSSFQDDKKMLMEEVNGIVPLISIDSSSAIAMKNLDSLSGQLILSIDQTLENYEKNKPLKDPLVMTLKSSEVDLEGLINILKEIRNRETDHLDKINSEVIASSVNIQVFIIVTSLVGFIVIGLALVISNKLIRSKNNTERLLQRSYEEMENKVEVRTSELKILNQSLLNEISGRVKIEKSLRESEQRFRNMADSSPIMIRMSGPDKLYTYFNKVWMDFTGRTLEQELGNGWSEGVHPEDLLRCMDTYILAFDKRKSFEMEYRLRNSDGEYRWILDKGIPLYEGEEFKGYIGCCIDIQSRKISERYLSLQHEVSRTLAESSSIEETFFKVLKNICLGIDWTFGIMWTADGSKNKLEPQVLWSTNRVHHKEFTQIYDHVIPKGNDLPGLVLKSGKSVWSPNLIKDYNFERKDLAARLGWKSAFAIPVTSGADVIGVIECFNDNEQPRHRKELLEVLEAVGRQIGNYLERKRAEDILKESHAELENRVKERTLELATILNKLLSEIEEKEKIQNKLKLFAHSIKGIKECIYITDLENKTVFVNSAFESIYGYFEQELLGKKIPVLFSESVSKDQIQDIQKQTMRLGWRGELKNTRKDGSEFHISLSTSVIRNDDGKIEAIVGICQDITEMKTAEERIIKQNKLLELLNDIINVVNKSFDLKNSISYAINKVCQYKAWDFGHCYMLDENDMLVSTSLFNFNLQDKYAALKKLTEDMKLKKGEGLVGEIMESGKPFWVNLEDKDENKYPRVKMGRKFGMKMAIVVPIMKQTEAIGALEFFKKDSETLDNELLDCISNIGIELGSLAERTEIIEKIKISEKQFKAVADTAVDAIITTDKNGKITYVNKSAEKVFGYSRDELLSSDLSLIIPQEFIHSYDDSFKKSVELKQLSLQGRTEELTARNKQGKTFPVEISISRWEINESIYFTAMIKDISERKMIETELIEKQKLLVDAQQIAKLGTWQWDVAGDSVIWSDSMFEIYEVERREFNPTLKGFFRYTHPEDSERIQNEILGSYNNKSPFSFYERIVTPKGKTKYLKSQGEIVLDEKSNVIKMFGTCLDITELKETEEKIMHSEKQLKEAQQVAKLGSWEINVLTGENSWSDEMFRICGISIDCGVPSYEQLIELLHPEDVDRVKSFIKTSNELPQQFDCDFRIVTREGVLKYVTVDVLKELDDEGNVVRFYGSAQDVTDIKIVEEELRWTNQKLLEAQKELIHNEKLAALGRFSSGIAHEIRNPLANISALSQLLAKSTLDEKSQKHLKYILINADIADKIIKDLLNFAAPVDPVFKDESITEILDNVLESVQARCVKSNIKTVKEITENLPTVNIDRIKFENAIMNFVSNALDAMQDMGGELRIKAFKDSIGWINISIADTGSGISQENLDKILEPFFTTKKNGTGLGLGLAYQTIKSHLGSVKISSKPGEGTIVDIKLPVNNNSNGKNISN